ncbi:MAG TPA: hypothetical protein VGC04_01250 [Cellulomonas sp.]
MSQLLGGAASPIGWSVQYLEVSACDLVEELLAWRTALGQSVRASATRAYPEQLHALLPFEAPWTRELVMACGDRWSAYLNNGVGGGDPTAAGPALAARLGVRCVAAMNAPRYGPGHQATQLWVQGPAGEPPLRYERTLAAHATDGRWTWHESGKPFDFEDTARYTSRRIRDRFDRPLLLRYLTALGIPADDDDSYGPGVVIQQFMDWPTRQETLEEARRSLAS